MRLLAAVMTIATLLPAGARASDFWDEVRTPGLRAWRNDLARARVALRARRFDQARTAAEAAITRLPDRAEGHVVRALVAGEVGALERAKEYLLTALSHDPGCLDNPAEGARAAEIFAKTGDYPHARQVLARLLGRMQPGGIRRTLYGLYGDVLLSLGPDQTADAIRAYREALRSGRHDPRASLGLALALRRQTAEGTEWRDLARSVASRGRLEALLSSLAVPEEERAARRAVAAEAIEDEAAARTAWRSIESGPWADHAAEQAQ
ncbi:MAG: tetratricopeptide repeat protein [Myxococcota bacterium]